MAARAGRRELATQRAPSARRTSRSSARLGLSVPHEWWPSAPLLKSYEAAGFGWVQLHSPPVSVLSDPRQCTAHGVAAATALATTSLQAVLHAPAGLRAGTKPADVAFEGMLSYAAEVGASQVVYHALGLPEGIGPSAELAAEARSLAAHASTAERLGLTIAIENLAPLYPGPGDPLGDPDHAPRAGPSNRLALGRDLPRPRPRARRRRSPPHRSGGALRPGARAGQPLSRPRQPRRPPPPVRPRARASTRCGSTSTCRPAAGRCRGTA